MTQAPEIPWHHAINARLLSLPHDVELIANDAARLRIAKFAGLNRIDSLVARLHLKAGQRDIIAVSGTIEARVWQVCTVSLEPFEAPLVADVAIEFASERTVEALEKRARLEEIEDFEPPDVLEGDDIDLGAIAVEFFILALDPHPRKPGAAFAPDGLDAAALSPFAALKGLVGPKESP